MEEAEKIEAGQTPPERRFGWERAGRIIATIGLIVLLILGAWGIIIIAFNTPSFFSNFSTTVSSWFGTSTPPSTSSGQAASTTPASSLPEQLTVSAALSSVPSGEPLAITWSDENAAGPRAFLISVSCVEGLTLEAPLPNNTYRKVPCNTGFNYTNEQSGVTLRPRLAGSAPQNVTVAISAISLATGSTTASGAASVTITPSGGRTAAPSTKTRPRPRITYRTYPSVRYASNPYGRPDLAARIIAVGYIDPQTGVFTPMANYQLPTANYQLLAVQFDIKNVGTKTAAPGWQFTASLPTNPPYTYTSQPEGALAPGSGIVFTLRWSNAQANTCYPPPAYPYSNYYPYQNYCPPTPPYYGRSVVTITVDPYHAVPDANPSNNTATASF